jgi:hypothetical protein
MGPGERRSALIFSGGVLAWLTCAGIAWLAPRPLGHDEAQYALAARDLLAGAEPRWFYLSSGMSAVAAAGVAAGASELALRLPAVLLGLGCLLAAGALAWRWYGHATAAWTVAVLAGMRALTRRSADLLSDLPAAGLLLAGTLVITAEATRPEGPRWRVVAAAPLLAGALYLRYASCVPIALLGAVTLVGCAREIARRPWPIAATAALFLALLAPHAASAVAFTGSPVGILLRSSEVPTRAWWAEGLVTYLTSSPVRYYGLLAAPVLLAGAAAGALAIVRRGPRPTAIFGAVGAGHILAMGLISHAQARYIFSGLVLLSVLGVHALRAGLERARHSPVVWRARAARIGGGIAAAAVGASWALSIRAAAGAAPIGAKTAGTLAAAAAIRADAAGAPCAVQGDAYPQLEWYSGCASTDLPDAPLARGEPVYAVDRPGAARAPTAGRGRVLLARPDLIVTRYDRAR